MMENTENIFTNILNSLINDSNVHILGTIGNPWFNLNDLLKILEIKRSKIDIPKFFLKNKNEIINREEKIVKNSKDSYINDKGLYFLIFYSDDCFRNHILNDLIPSVGKKYLQERLFYRVMKDEYEIISREQEKRLNYPVKDKIMEMGSILESMETILGDIDNVVRVGDSLEQKSNELYDTYSLLQHANNESCFLLVNKNYVHLYNKYKIKFELIVSKKTDNFSTIVKNKIKEVNNTASNESVHNIKSSELYIKSSTSKKRQIVINVKSENNMLIGKITKKEPSTMKITLTRYKELDLYNLLNNLNTSIKISTTTT